MYRLAIAMTVLALAFGAGPVAVQQPACSERSDVLDHLNNQYSEAPVAMRLANSGGVVEIFSSKPGKSWTIILTMPNGMSCMIAAGENWESLHQLVQIVPAA